MPTLQAAGVDIVHTEVYSSTDAGNVVADAPGRVFRLRAAGVTHVIHFATPLYDMIAADAQGWRPAWAVTSRAGPGAFLEGSAPPGQLPRAAGPAGSRCRISTQGASPVRSAPRRSAATPCCAPPATS